MHPTSFEHMLRQSLHEETPPRADHVAATQVHCADALRIRRPRRSFASFLWLQWRLLGWKIWLVQALCLATGMQLFGLFDRPQAMLTPWLMSHILASLSVGMTLVALPFLYRSIHHHMHELEAATHFSSTGLLQAQLLLIAIGEILLLFGLLLWSLWHSPLNTMAIALTLAIPGLAASGAILWLLRHLSAAHFLWMGAGLGMTLLLAVSVMPFSQSLLAFIQGPRSGVLLTLVLLIFCTIQYRRLIHASHFSEWQCA